MRCENYYCVYWCNNNCTLTEISLDIQGNCQECILVDIDQSTIQKAREQFIAKYEN